MNIIGDIAGRFDELMLLIDKMPKEEIILLGDLNDRGLKTKEVIQWAIDNKIRCVKSNHGQMMIDAYNIWLATGNPHGSWEFNANGGIQTIQSYGGFEFIPKEHIQYLVDCEWFIETDDLILTHAPIHPTFEFGMPLTTDFLWNRENPKPRDKFQIHGHNSILATYMDHSGKKYGMCIDDCFHKNLIGINSETMTLYKQDYL
jgi:hypothetical protein